MLTRTSKPSNGLASLATQRRTARANTPQRLPAQPKAGEAQARIIKGR